MHGHRVINRQRSGGFIYALLLQGIALALSLAGNAILWQRTDVVKWEFEVFKEKTRAAGLVAKERKDKIDFWNGENLRIANEKLKTELDRHAVDIKRVRLAADSRIRSLPRAPENYSKPHLLCLDREIYEYGRRASLDRFRKRIRSIADRCTTGAIKYESLCTWAKGIK